MTDELGVARGVATGVRDLYATIEDQGLSVLEVIGVLVSGCRDAALAGSNINKSRDVV